MTGEFALIDQYFKQPAAQQLIAAGQSVLGIGDDCALLDVPPGMRLAVSKDMLIEHQHFFSNVDPQSLGHKTLAVNLSDLAAMGAKPLGCLLGLGLPQVDDAWLSAFSKGFLDLATASGCPLIGGDTVKTPNDISLSVTVLGYVPRAQPALLRHAAQVSDDIWVSGELGAADLAYRIRAGLFDLSHMPSGQVTSEKVSLNELSANPLMFEPARIDSTLLDQVNRALDWPTPRLQLGQALLGKAHAAVDISDGLLQDLNHILQASHVGAILYEPLLPVSSALLQVSPEVRQHAILSGGEAYELCFTASQSARAQLSEMAQQIGVQLTRIGQIVEVQGISIFDQDNRLVTPHMFGFDHFSKQSS
jgi:thiamine-monophosphate kinase